MQTLEDWKKSLRAINPIEVGRHNQGCDWTLPDGNIIMHGRTYFPWSPFKEITESYWTNPTFTNKSEAERLAGVYGGEATECFYCDPESPTYFVSFNDFDKACNYSFNAIRFCDGSGAIKWP